MKKGTDTTGKQGPLGAIMNNDMPQIRKPSRNG